MNTHAVSHFEIYGDVPIHLRCSKGRNIAIFQPDSQGKCVDAAWFVRARRGYTLKNGGHK